MTPLIHPPPRESPLVREVFGKTIRERDVPTLGGSVVTLATRTALAGIALYAMAPSGVYDQRLAYQLSTFLPRLRHFQGTSNADIYGVINSAMEVGRQNGADVLLNWSSRSLPPELRPPALAIALELLALEEPSAVGLGDLTVATRLARALGVPTLEADTISHAMRLLAKA